VHPIHFLYGHLHNSIRTELDNLSSWVLALEGQDNEHDLVGRLVHLKERYHFLEQVYKYHSSVEDEVGGAGGAGWWWGCMGAAQSSDAATAAHRDGGATASDVLRAAPCVLVPTQVVYPALDSKVKNVTSAYSVEHQDEVRLGWVPAWGAERISELCVRAVLMLTPCPAHHNPHRSICLSTWAACSQQRCHRRGPSARRRYGER
jgi:hypothetical protein